MDERALLEKKESDKHYVESMKMWDLGQKRIISGLGITINNAHKMIEHFTAVADLDTAQCLHEKDYHASVMNNFREWCSHNSIEIPEWAKN